MKTTIEKSLSNLEQIINFTGHGVKEKTRVIWLHVMPQPNQQQNTKKGYVNKQIFINKMIGNRQKVNQNKYNFGFLILFLHFERAVRMAPVIVKDEAAAKIK